MPIPNSTMAMLNPDGRAPKYPAAKAEIEKTTVAPPITAKRRSAPRPGGIFMDWAVTDVGGSRKMAGLDKEPKMDPQSRHGRRINR
jgi:hypothetical protein